MRRILQKQANRPRRCKSLLMENTSPTSSSRNNIFGASRRQLAFDAAQSPAQFSTVPPIFPSRSRCFEVQDVSARLFSAEAIYAHSTSNDVTMSPFWYHGPSKTAHSHHESIAPMELFQAILTLKRVSSPKVSILDVDSYVEKWDNNIRTHGQKAGGNQEVNKTVTLVTNMNTSGIHAKFDANNIDQLKQKLSYELDFELRQKVHSTTSLTRIVNIFHEERSSTHELLNDKQLLQIFHHFVDLDLISSFEVLKHCVARCKEKGRLVKMDMYQKLIHRIQPFPTSNQPSKPATITNQLNTQELQALVEDITQHIKDEYSEGKAVVYQYLLLPELTSSLVDYKHPDISSMATQIMQYILEREFPMLNPEIYEYILTKGRRGDDGQVNFQYSRVLSYLVLSGYVPRPAAVRATLQCYHPFTDHKTTHEVLSLVQTLHSLNLDSPVPNEGYHIDFGTLESISMASARKNAELVLLVWDLVELFGYTPTASMYEDVVLSFTATHQDENLFAALADMEKNGFVPSPVFLRYIARKITYYEKRAIHSEKMLTWHRNNHLRSTHGMNSLLIGYGMKRDINSAFLIFEDFAKFNIDPDSNTFAFLMEALYVDAKDRFPYSQRLQFNPQDIEDVVGAAQIVIDAMAEAGIKRTKKFIYEHIRLLYTLDLLDDAKSVLVEAISAGTPVPKATIFSLGSRFANVGDFENARDVAGMSRAAGCGDFPRLVNLINNLEERADSS